MAHSVLSGIGLGAVFSLALAGAVSLLVPITPQTPPQTGGAEGVAPAAVPPGEAAPRPVAEAPRPLPAQPQVSLRAPVEPAAEPPEEPAAAAQPPVVGTAVPAPVTGAPTTDQTSPTAPTPEVAPARTAAAPRPDVQQSVEAAPVIPARPAVPQTGPAGDLTQPRPLPDGVIARSEGDAPVLPNPQALAPMLPDGTPDPDISTETAALPEADAGEESFVLVPQIPAPEEDAPAATAEAETAQPPNDTPETAQTAEAPQQPDTEQPDTAQTETDEPETVETAQTVLPRVIPAPGSAGVAQRDGDRPRIGRPATTLIAPDPADTGAAPAVADVVQDPATLPPIQRFAAEFANPDDKPLMSIVLIDDGAPQDADDIGLPALASFPYPITLAIDADLPDAPQRMARYRAEGFEVLAMVDLPPGARPTDAEVSLGVALAALPEVVGVLDGTGAGLQSSREVADQVTAILKSEGLGLVAQGKGLDTMPKLAVKEGVPAAPVFRDFDSEGQDARVIRRFLDQAAFKAGQENGVVTLGRLRPETIKALLVWGLADRAGRVALAPVSALLRARVE
ncbi:divergent polysaccharide deacetylase family protein [Sulfitobacter albidus]|uniref:Divergent polysaccharide deacetylase family protein n=1 Tax=Sulfitobacter albidus TaxID=2829501 RepID=A0A975PNZ6_9RHOB|nr:divergent polysaccharide deacetylase family protein [Sulfitobacter albidus]QUJ77840.1 divergent polysaccharide deacetylase family protein [Sulfitobacter albidus]